MDIKQFFDREGYVIVRNAVPKSVCEHAKQAFIRDVQPDTRFFIRHESGEYERHVFTDAGFMKYPIMNFQNLLSKKFTDFRQHGLNVLTSDRIREVIETLLGTTGRINHTMYFDGNQQTWAHRDSDYIDQERSGDIIGVWVAAEDIHPGAGRFFVHAASHHAQFPEDWRIEDMDPNGNEYKMKMANFFPADSTDHERIAPELKQGDAIVWSCQTIHGSLETTSPDHSRRSFTAHYESTRPVTHENRASMPALVNGVEVAHQRNQMRMRAQLPALIRANHPALFQICLVLVNIIRGILKRLSQLKQVFRKKVTGYLRTIPPGE